MVKCIVMEQSRLICSKTILFCSVPCDFPQRMTKLGSNCLSLASELKKFLLHFAASGTSWTGSTARRAQTGSRTTQNYGKCSFPESNVS